MLSQADYDNYGSEFIDLTRRAAVEAVSPELQQLRAQNQRLRQMAARSQRAEIERTLDAQIPNWHEIYQNPAFAQWLATPDGYSGAVRSQLMRQAVDVGDAGRVVSFYRGFQQEAGRRASPAHQSRGGAQSRPAATGAKPIYTREQIKHLYDQRRHGTISDANWARIEADIIAAGREGRVTSSFDKYGNERRLI